MSVVFHRTANGLTNQALFANADYVLFVEGGEECLIEDIERGAGDPCTLDTAFWSSILQCSPSSQRIHVRSIGGKGTVRAIAQLVSEKEVARVMVALDRDFDDRRGSLLHSSKVFYTYGYSWETDVFTAEVAKETVKSLVPPSNVIPDINRAIENAARELERGFSMLVRMDHCLAMAGAELTNREKVRRSINLDKGLPPKINRATIAAELRRQRMLGKARRIEGPASATVDRDLDGHAKARWWLHTLRHLFRLYVKQGLSDDVIQRLAIATYLRQGDSQSLSHYRAMVATI